MCKFTKKIASTDADAFRVSNIFNVVLKDW